MLQEIHLVTLQELQGSHTIRPDKLGGGFFLGLSERIERLVSGGGKASLQKLDSELVQAIGSLYQNSDSDVRRSVRDDVPGEILQAYRLGQLSGMQYVSAKFAMKRVSDDFADFLSRPEYQRILETLWMGEADLQDIYSCGDEKTQTIDRKLSKLQEVGAIASVREERAIRLFLTPAARALLATRSG
jgi:DNA-binding MarR family transcriptional regulator